jgi:hypothetical protein
VGNIIYGTEGFVAFGNEDTRAVAAFDADGKLVKTFRGSASHFGNFISAVESRSQSDLHCPILEGHLSSAMCHLANISYRTGKPRAFAARAEMLGDRVDLAEAFGRFEQHLADSTIKLQQASYQLGPRHAFDPETERFPQSPQANALLTREYRKPFVVPEQV